MKESLFALIILLVLVLACTPNYNVQNKAQVNVSVPTKIVVLDNISAQTGSQSEIKEFRLVIYHTGYSPNTVTVKKGDTVRLLVSSGPGTLAHHHGVTITEYGINQLITTENPTNPQAIEFVASQSGTFSIWCQSCWTGVFGQGHPDIRATLVVEE